MANLLPTKGNLIAAKRSRTLARTGYELMDRKRNILIRELMGMIDTAKELQGQIDAVFTEAYTALQAANIRLGICDRIAEAVDVDDSLTLRSPPRPGRSTAWGIPVPSWMSATSSSTGSRS